MAKRKNDYFLLATEQVEYCVKASALLVELFENYSVENVLTYKDKIHEIEHLGDEIRHDIISRLAVEFITPIDQEDILHLVQIIDDIMDVEGTFDSIGKTPHKDESVDKLTAIKIFGVEGAKNQAKLHYDLCLQALKDIPNNDFLLELTNAMFNRRS